LVADVVVREKLGVYGRRLLGAWRSSVGGDSLLLPTVKENSRRVEGRQADRAVKKEVAALDDIGVGRRWEAGGEGLFWATGEERGGGAASGFRFTKYCASMRRLFSSSMIRSMLRVVRSCEIGRRAN
jgi:hypothetical protein